MNDCVWGMTGICDGEECRCKLYHSANDIKGREIMTEFEEDLKEAFKPVKDKFVKIKLGGQ